MMVVWKDHAIINFLFPLQRILLMNLCKATFAVILPCLNTISKISCDTESKISVLFTHRLMSVYIRPDVHF